MSAQLFNQDGVHNFNGRDWYKAWGTIPDATGMLHVVPHVVSGDATFGGMIFAPGTPLQRPDVQSRRQHLALCPERHVLRERSARRPRASSARRREAAQDLGAPDRRRSIPMSGTTASSPTPITSVTSDFKVFAQYLRGEESTFRYNTPGGSIQGTPTAVTIFSGNALSAGLVQQIMTDNNIASFTLRKRAARATGPDR